MSVYELSTESWLGESDEELKKRLRKFRNFRRRAITRIIALILKGLPAPALPPADPVVEVPKGKPRGGQGEAELAALPEGTVMERLGRLAATTPNEAEAEAFAGALPMLAATLVPAATPAMASAASQMVSGMSSAARVLRESEQTRDLVRWLPAVARGAALRIGRQAARGRAVTPDTCARILADTAVRVLSEAALEAGASFRLPSGLPVLVFDYNTHPDLADNVWHAQAAGHCRELTYLGDRELARRNRGAATYGIPAILSRDEYPFASTVEGGGSAWIGHIPGRQNSAQGGILSKFYRRWSPKGGRFRFRVAVVNHPKGPVPAPPPGRRLCSPAA